MLRTSPIRDMPEYRDELERMLIGMTLLGIGLNIFRLLRLIEITLDLI